MTVWDALEDAVDDAYNLSTWQVLELQQYGHFARAWKLVYGTALLHEGRIAVVKRSQSVGIGAGDRIMHLDVWFLGGGIASIRMSNDSIIFCYDRNPILDAWLA